MGSICDSLSAPLTIFVIPSKFQFWIGTKSLISKMQIILLLLPIVSLANGQVITWGDGGCPEVTTKEDFDLVPYMGTWWELEKYPNSFQKGDCGVANYELQDDSTVAVNNTELRPDGKIGTAIGQARSDPRSTIPAHLQVRFSKWQPWGKYWVLDTDYKSFSVVYSCSSYLINRVEFLWILGRAQSLTPERRQAISSMLGKFKIDESKLRKTSHGVEKCGDFHV